MVLFIILQSQARTETFQLFCRLHGPWFGPERYTLNPGPMIFHDAQRATLVHRTSHVSEAKAAATTSNENGLGFGVWGFRVSGLGFRLMMINDGDQGDGSSDDAERGALASL